MNKFEIRDDFYLNDRPFKIMSGAIHYFRVHPDDWSHSLYNLKSLGFNTVETYIPWNLHEPHKGTYDFCGQLDIEAFLAEARALGLYAIVRPTPYICAEWEFGGLPAWLLEEDCRIRSSDPAFLALVEAYYGQLLPRLVKHQLSEGGNILMMQVENEYGSYGEDKAYLRGIRDLMRAGGVTCPLFTSDGPWQATLRAGSLIEDDVLTTGNFGSRSDENFDMMQAFFDRHGKQWPLMCMEFWDGWFNRWGEPIVTREPEELADAVMACLRRGSINLYMFHGGTNFGFMNGCSARNQHDLPQVTSYDYEAILDEAGNPSPKYYALKRALKAEFPDIAQLEPRIKPALSAQAVLVDKVSLFEVLPQLAQPRQHFYTQTMEALGQAYGYTLYQTQDHWDADKEKLRIIDARDRAQVYVDDELVATQYQEAIGDVIELETVKDAAFDLKILVENMGRVNYGSKLLAATQRKGIQQGVMRDLHFMGNWTHYPLSFDRLDQLDFSGDWKPRQPAFYAFEVELDQPADTYLDMSGFGKGCVFVNQHHIGRFWCIGPTLSLYVPKGFLKKGGNQIIVFETEGIAETCLNLESNPKFKNINKEDPL